jgi:hypothetical protein
MVHISLHKALILLQLFSSGKVKFLIKSLAGRLTRADVAAATARLAAVAGPVAATASWYCCSRRDTAEASRWQAEASCRGVSARRRGSRRAETALAMPACHSREGDPG